MAGSDNCMVGSLFFKIDIFQRCDEQNTVVGFSKEEHEDLFAHTERLLVQGTTEGQE